MRAVPADLLLHLQQSNTTPCYLLKVLTSNGRLLTFTSIDKEIEYDDGTGILTYYPVINAAGFKRTATLEVDNSEFPVLLDVKGTFSRQEIRAGLLDSGKFWVYRINFEKPEDGHYIADFGTIGITATEDSMAGVLELRGQSQTLKQNINDQYSLTCRAVFGSQEGEELYPCYFDYSGMWTTGTVVAVDANEPDRIFTANYSQVSGPNGLVPFVPGLVVWESGNNINAKVETEKVTDITGEGNIELQFAVPGNIQIGDTFKMRPDCPKTKRACIDLFDNYEWMRAEDTIPVTDEKTAGQPGANVPGLGQGIITSLN